MQIGGDNYNTNQIYYIAGETGENTANYPRLSIFSDAYINSNTGMSLKYPEYHFDFKLIQYNKYDSGLASIYKLVITKIITT
jgi:hypothetical protein